MQLPDFALEAIERIERCGFSAYAVGGCVRDSLMGKTPADWDLTVSARPDDVLKIFADCKTIPTGLKHGTVTVIMRGERLEITTFRIDGTYRDCRRPDSVSFTDSLGDDLSRRDFTVCAMAFNPRTGIVDLFGGREDIQKKLIRCVGSPERRFEEDALRIMRALRFSAALGFEIEETTSSAILQCRDKLRLIAAERISSELVKLLLSSDPTPVIFKYRTVFAEIMPDIAFELRSLHDLAPVAAADRSVAARLAALFRILCADADSARKTMRGLKFDNKTILRTLFLLHHADSCIPTDKTALKKIMRSISADGLSDVIFFKHAFAEADAQKIHLEKAADTVRDILSCGECFTLGALAVRGADLIALGIPKGRKVGEALGFLLDCVIDGRCENKRRELLALAAEFKSL